MSKEVAVIVGVGPGLGRALVARCSSEGMAVAAVARDADRLREITKGLKKGRGLAPGFCDGVPKEKQLRLRKRSPPR